MKQEFCVATFYKFFKIEQNLTVVKDYLYDLLKQHSIYGTILIAPEGINSTIVGTDFAIKQVLEHIEKYFAIQLSNCKFSESKLKPFLRTKIKIKKEIVTLGITNLDMKNTGIYADAKHWNQLIADKQTLVIDTRNDYEITAGTFPGAVNLNTTSFRQFPDFVKKQIQQKQPKQIAMFCTGGIRCEKASAYLKNIGIEKVYQLDGGILKYLDTIDSKDNKWDGECFVFDDRVTVDKNLNQGNYKQCFACRIPLKESAIASDMYKQGISCPFCYDKKSPEQKKRYAMRQNQIQLAKKKGYQHLG